MNGSFTSKEPFAQRFVLTNAREDIEQAQRTILGAIEARAFDPSCCFGIRLALEEGLSNAFKHGNQGDPSKTVKLNCRIVPGKIHIEIEDEGQGFNPDAVPDPTESENVEIPAGRGLVLMKSFMTAVVIHPPGNRIEMIFEIPGQVK
ncbi:MAG: ATP-binding protein [Planctomycetota bacterium]|nr:ATP-binding protein [Planctomycetota bacterium]